MLQTSTFSQQGKAFRLVTGCACLLTPSVIGAVDNLTTIGSDQQAYDAEHPRS